MRHTRMTRAAGPGLRTRPAATPKGGTDALTRGFWPLARSASCSSVTAARSPENRRPPPPEFTASCRARSILVTTRMVAPAEPRKGAHPSDPGLLAPSRKDGSGHIRRLEYERWSVMVHTPRDPRRDPVRNPTVYLAKQTTFGPCAPRRELPLARVQAFDPLANVAATTPNPLRGLLR